MSKLELAASAEEPGDGEFFVLRISLLMTGPSPVPRTVVESGPYSSFADAMLSLEEREASKDAGEELAECDNLPTEATVWHPLPPVWQQKGAVVSSNRVVARARDVRKAVGDLPVLAAEARVSPGTAEGAGTTGGAQVAAGTAEGAGTTGGVVGTTGSGGEGAGGEHAVGHPRPRKARRSSELSAFNPSEAPGVAVAAAAAAAVGASTSGARHLGVTCSSCQACPISGARYKCMVCPDYNLCETCELTTGVAASSWEITAPPRGWQGSHKPSHPMLKLKDPVGHASCVLAQNTHAWSHKDATCSVCKAHPIRGVKFSCMVCQVEVCQVCDFNGFHAVDHPVLRLTIPNDLKA